MINTFELEKIRRVESQMKNDSNKDDQLSSIVDGHFHSLQVDTLEHSMRSEHQDVEKLGADNRKRKDIRTATNEIFHGHNDAFLEQLDNHSTEKMRNNYRYNVGNFFALTNNTTIHPSMKHFWIGEITHFNMNENPIDYSLLVHCNDTVN